MKTQEQKNKEYTKLEKKLNNMLNSGHKTNSPEVSEIVFEMLILKD
jgi:hypothetical protein